MNLIENLERTQLKPKVAEFRVGDVVRVKAKVVEGGRQRLQAFEGIVIARDSGGVHEAAKIEVDQPVAPAKEAAGAEEPKADESKP